ncbi:ECF-type riboflavin transporter, S component [Fictibacillus solisalsi]|uniref:ECF-type riboflavin transporter, S component n=1 Tax=Fictibacillus solisalsi TaxID=459525 RepID=A0A1G9XU62_9BACL|nr:ECF transporter S component [Fictibacillus solisalsi]SDM99715.1 ECF-type riboflavin transporter, S component [Fictibacillus solisalsi]
MIRNKNIALFTAFVSLAVAGSFIKIPSPIGSVAFDSMPALAAAALMSPWSGLAVAGFGHLLTAALAGFPLGPLHVVVAVQMGFLAFFYGVLYGKNAKTAATIMFVLGNGILAPLCFWPVLGKAAVLGLIPSLLAAAILNALTALVIIPRIKPVFRQSAMRINHEKKS